MSATARSATARPVSRRTPSRPAARRRPTLTEVPAPRAAVAGNGIFALIVIALLLGGMAVLLVLNTTLAQGAFEIGALTRTQNQLGVAEQRLIQQVALEESPDALQRRADRLGMVPVSSPVFLRLADGAVLGTPTPAVVAHRGAGASGSPTTVGSSTSAATGNSAPRSATATTTKGAATGAAATQSHAAAASPSTQSDAAVLTPPTTTSGAHR